jgi:hypothetical protein
MGYTLPAVLLTFGTMLGLLLLLGAALPRAAQARQPT